MPKQKEKLSTILKSKSSELFIDSIGTEEFCSSFMYEPTNIEESSLGNLYIVGEVKTFSKKCAYLVNSLSSVIRKELYRSHKRNSLESFESGLSKANAYLANIASQENIDWIGHIDMVCVLLGKNQIHISQVGNARALLLRDNYITPITEESQQEEPPFPSKTFSNITSGPVTPDDKIVLATSGLFNALSTEEIKHSISGMSCKQGIQNIGELSEMDEDAETSSIIILDILSPVQPTSSITEQSEGLNKNQSIESLMVSPKLSLAEIVKNGSSYIQPEIAENESLDTLENDVDNDVTTKSKEEKQSKIKNIYNIILPLAKKVLLISFKFTKKLAILSIKFAKTLLSQIKKIPKMFSRNKTEISENNKKPVVIKIRRNTSPSDEPIAKQNNFLNALPKISVIKLSTIVFVLTFGTIGIFFLKNKRPKEKIELSASLNIEKCQKLIEGAEQKRQDAETALIYKDEGKARNLLAEASTLIEESINLGINSKEATEIKNSIQIQLDQINRIINIQNPFLVNNIKENSEDKPFKTTKIFGGEKNLMLLDYQNSQVGTINLVKYNLTNQRMITLLPNENIIGSAILKDGLLSAITNFSTILKIPLEDIGIGHQNIVSALDLSTVKDICVYNEIIYLLLNNQNQILKVSSGRANPWIEGSGIDLSQAISMAIDGNIFVLTSNKDILKLSGGKLKDTFSLEGADLVSPNLIYTNSDLDKLFILDSLARKIIITDKNGVILSQYKSEKFNDLKSIYVDPKTGSIYVLNDNCVYRIDR